MLRRIVSVGVVLLFGTALSAVAQRGSQGGGNQGSGRDAERLGASAPVFHPGSAPQGAPVFHPGTPTRGNAPGFHPGPPTGGYQPGAPVSFQGFGLTMPPVLPINNPVLPPNNPVLPINSPVLPPNNPVLPINTPVLPITPLQWSGRGGYDQMGRYGRPGPGGDDGDHRRDHRFRDGHRDDYGAFGGYVVPYAVTVIDPGCLNSDCGYYSNPGYDSSAAPETAAPATEAYPQQPEPYQQPIVEPAVAPTITVVQPPYPAEPLPQVSSPEQEIGVTLLFKDGRPPETIHNFVLTRTAVYVQGRWLRAIPMDQIDLKATQDLNQKNGIDFELPGA